MSWMIERQTDKCEALLDFYQNVMLFNKLAGNDVENLLLIPKYKDFLREEVSEAICAFKLKDPLNFIEEIADSLFVASYLMALECGEVCLKDTVSPMRLAYLEPAMKALESSLEPDSEIFNGVVMLTLLEEIAMCLDCDLAGVLDAVAVANLSKFPLIGSIDPNWEVERILEEGRYTCVTYMKLEGRYVFKDGHGKVLKPSTFEKEDLVKYLPDYYKTFETKVK